MPHEHQKQDVHGSGGLKVNIPVVEAESVHQVTTNRCPKKSVSIHFNLKSNFTTKLKKAFFSVSKLRSGLLINPHLWSFQTGIA